MAIDAPFVEPVKRPVGLKYLVLRRENGRWELFAQFRDKLDRGAFVKWVSKHKTMCGDGIAEYDL